MKENEKPQEVKKEIFEITKREYELIQSAVNALTDYKATGNRVYVNDFNYLGAGLEQRAMEVGFLPKPKEDQPSDQGQENSPAEPVEAEIVDK